MSEPERDRIVRTLTAEESPLRDELVRLAVDHVLSRTLKDLVDLNEATSIVMGALTEENAARVIGRHVQPGFHRYLKQVAASADVVGDLVPPVARDKIRDIAKKSKLPRGAWTEGLVEPALVRKLFAPVWVHLLLNFGSRLPLPGMGAASGAAAAVSSAVGKGMGGIAGRLSRSAEKLAGAGRTVMGGLGAEVEKRVQSAAREFSEGAAEVFREALKDRLKSREGRDLVEQITGQAVDHVMQTKLAAIHEDVLALPVDAIFDVSADIIGHASKRAFVRQIVESEVHAFLALEGERTLAAVLTELGVLDSVRGATIRGASPIVRGFFASEPFSDFLGRLLGA